MEYLIGLLIAAIGGLLFFKNKADKATADAKLAEVKGRDKELQITQKELQDFINQVDTNIAKMKAQQEQEARKRKENNMSLKERADRIKKGLK